MVSQLSCGCVRKNPIRFLQDRLPAQRGAQAQGFSESTKPTQIPEASSKIEDGAWRTEQQSPRQLVCATHPDTHPSVSLGSQKCQMTSLCRLGWLLSLTLAALWNNPPEIRAPEGRRISKLLDITVSASSIDPDGLCGARRTIRAPLQSAMLSIPFLRTMHPTLFCLQVFYWPSQRCWPSYL